jgi:hypothetical protein
MPRYEHVSGAAFAIIALGQLVRAVLGLPVQVSTFAVPVWCSFVAFAVTAGLAVWAWRTAKGAA